ncbi:Rv3654c family TadE-like protein [Humibacter albus]|jgi:secretion/DNA translocation related TadE-like protein|uniref:Rv3654c family TadE-like protein n=1 Tax=Humibacter albus TaxID=427754 RepID=UPI0003B52604|nr:Rv3654c family TadE-like protein [Humibacter albus]
MTSWSERGSASVAVVGLLAALILTTAAALGACALLAAKQGVVAAADAAALAAADTVSGRVAGSPCGRAGEAARLNGASLGACELSGLNALVSARRVIAGVPIEVWARAGPPQSKTASMNR